MEYNDFQSWIFYLVKDGRIIQKNYLNKNYTIFTYWQKKRVPVNALRAIYYQS